MQDSVKLDEVGQDDKDESLGTYSSVAVLQEHLFHWFCFSLLDANTDELLSQRLKFLMVFIHTANKKSHVLPSGATADIHFSLFMFAFLIDSTNLKLHPVIKPHMGLVQKLAQCHTPEAMTLHTSKIRASHGRGSVRLPSMRVRMTKALVFNDSAKNLIKTPTLRSKAQILIAQGGLIDDYFNINRHHALIR